MFIHFTPTQVRTLNFVVKKIHQHIINHLKAKEELKYFYKLYVHKKSFY